MLYTPDWARPNGARWLPPPLAANFSLTRCFLLFLHLHLHLLTPHRHLSSLFIFLWFLVFPVAGCDSAGFGTCVCLVLFLCVWPAFLAFVDLSASLLQRPSNLFYSTLSDLFDLSIVWIPYSHIKKPLSLRVFAHSVFLLVACCSLFVSVKLAWAWIGLVYCPTTPWYYTSRPSIP